MFNLFFLPFFYLKERHYTKTSIFPCKGASILTSYTPTGVVEMLLLVGTLPCNFISTWISRGELELCFINLPTFLPNKKGGFPALFKVFTFSIRDFQTYFTLISQHPLQRLNFLPSVLYKSEGWR